MKDINGYTYSVNTELYEQWQTLSRVMADIGNPLLNTELTRQQFHDWEMKMSGMVFRLARLRDKSMNHVFGLDTLE